MKSPKQSLKKNNNGFTLIELMMVVAIIGILAAIAMPAYQEYLIRTKLIELTRFSGAAKIYIWEEYFIKAQMPDSSSLAADTTEQMILASELVDEANYTRIDENQAEIEVKLSDFSGVVKDETIIYKFITDGETIDLDCKGGSLPDRYRAPACKS